MEDSFDTFDDVSSVAQVLVRKLQERIVDEGMVDSLMPSFSPMGADDRAVTAMAVLGTVEYFEYGTIFSFGFPSITLEGERSDWEALARMVGGLARFRDEVAEWARCLGKLVDGMLATFDRPEDPSVEEFWMKACHSAGGGGSGDVLMLSGWLTSFCW